MAKQTTPKPPKSPGSGNGRKKNGNSKTVIRTALVSKIEELVRTSELDMMLQRRNLGLEPKGDMKDFIRDLIKNLKRVKR
jgi:hypothetical protein